MGQFGAIAGAAGQSGGGGGGMGGMGGMGGGGGGIFGQLIQDIRSDVKQSEAGFIGGAVGGITGAMEQGQRTRERRRLRDAARIAEGQTNAQVFNILNSPEVTAQRNFLRGLFGEEAFGQFGGGDPSGLFSGGTNVGGDILFDTGGGRRGMKNRGGGIGRRVARGIEAQRMLDSGATRSGRPLGQQRQRRLERRANRGQAAADFLEENRQFLTGAARAIQNRGIGLDAASAFAGANDEPRRISSSAPGGTAALDPFTSNVQTGLRQSLLQSGFGQSLVGAAAQGLGTGLAKTQLQAQLLPMLQQQAVLGDTLRGQFLGDNFNLAVSRAGLPVGFGPNPFGQALLGFQQGFMQGAS